MLEYGISYGAVNLDFFDLAHVAPRPYEVAEGGSEKAGGILVGYRVRAERGLSVPLLFAEQHYPAVARWIDYAQIGGVFAFLPRRGVPSVSYLCYLDSPKLGDEWSPDRHSFPGRYALTVKIYTVNGTRFDVRYFA